MFSDDNGIKLEIYDRGHPWGACRERCGPRLKLWGKWYFGPQEELLKKASEKRSEKSKENQEKQVSEAKPTENSKEKPCSMYKCAIK